MKKKNPIHAHKRLLAKDQDWDFCYLIALEKKKLQRMHDCIKRESRLEHKDFVVRDIRICIRLIDIFMEEDAVYKNWLHQSFSGKMKFTKVGDNLYEIDNDEYRPIADYPVYVEAPCWNLREYRKVIFPLTSKICLFFYGAEEKEFHKGNKLVPILPDAYQDTIEAIAFRCNRLIVSENRITKKQIKILKSARLKMKESMVK